MRFNSYEIFYDRKDKGDLLIQVTTRAGLTVYIKDILFHTYTQYLHIIAQ